MKVEKEKPKLDPATLYISSSLGILRESPGIQKTKSSPDVNSQQSQS